MIYFFLPKRPKRPPPVFFSRPAKGSLMEGGADFLMSLEEPPTVLLRAVYLAWLALRAASFFFASSAAAFLALAAASLFFLARSLAFCAAAAAFLRSASCFAFIALRRASVSMVLPAETEKPALALALKACRLFGGTGVGGRQQRVFAGGNLELSAYQMRINIRRARVDGGLARARTVRTDPHHRHARKDIESFEVTGRSPASLASSPRPPGGAPPRRREPCGGLASMF